MSNTDVTWHILHIFYLTHCKYWNEQNIDTAEVTINYKYKTKKSYTVITFMVTKSIRTGDLWPFRGAGKARWGRACVTTPIIVFWRITTVLGMVTWWPITITVLYRGIGAGQCCWCLGQILSTLAWLARRQRWWLLWSGWRERWRGVSYIW